MPIFGKDAAHVGLSNQCFLSIQRFDHRPFVTRRYELVVGMAEFPFSKNIMVMRRTAPMFLVEEPCVIFTCFTRPFCAISGGATSQQTLETTVARNVTPVEWTHSKIYGTVEMQTLV